MPREERMQLVAEMLEQAATVSDDERERILEEVILLNQCVAESIASRFNGRGIAAEDLRQVACEALVKAVRRFDPALHHDLLSYAVPTIRGEVLRHFRDHGWLVRPPRRIQELQQQIGRTRDDLAVELARDPDPAEVAEAAGITEADHRDAMEAYGCFHGVSLDQPREPGTDTTLADVVVADDSTVQATEARLTLAPVVRELPSRDRRILYLRFYEQRTQAEIGEELGVTQTQVSRLLSDVLTRLRDQVGDVPAP
jgi:RNA polymerase sigma-B factor